MIYIKDNEMDKLSVNMNSNYQCSIDIPWNKCLLYIVVDGFVPSVSTVVVSVAGIPPSRKRILKLTIIIVGRIHAAVIRLRYPLWAVVIHLERHVVIITIVVHIIFRIFFLGGFRTTICDKNMHETSMWSKAVCIKRFVFIF